MKKIILDTSPLILTENSKSELVCGLSWDPKVEAGISDKISNAMGRNTETFDLDLSCYCYDENKSVMDFVTGEPHESVDRSGLIKHSGDCRHGEQDGDDESITIDLNALPDYIQHIVFLVEVGSAHSFNDVENPLIRIADSTTNQSLTALEIDKVAGDDYSACVYTTLSRHENNQWLLFKNNYFLDHEDIESWSDFCSQFITE